MSLARIVATLVERGEEDLAEELIRESKAIASPVEKPAVVIALDPDNALITQIMVGKETVGYVQEFEMMLSATKTNPKLACTFIDPSTPGMSATLSSGIKKAMALMESAGAEIKLKPLSD
jgi:hypothetical protein